MNQVAEVSRPMIRGSATTKIERYKWKAKDSPGRFQQIPKTQILVDPAYQRDLVEDKVRELRGNWSYVACGAISVVRRDGKFWAVEGQHRLAAAKARADITHMPCMVFELDSVEEEAAAFLNANKNRKPLTSLDTFKAAIVSGDQVALAAQKLLSQAGYVASRHDKARGVRAIGSIMHGLRTDAEAFKSVWPAIVAAAQGQAIQERVILGLFWIERHRRDDSLGDPKWVKRLAQVGQPALLEAAAKASAYYARGGAQVWGPGMMLAINKRMREKFHVNKVVE